MHLLAWLVAFLGLAAAAAILVFSLGQAWLAFHYHQSKSDAQKLIPPPPWAGPLPTVLVQLPIYNERYVVERLLDCMAKLDYPADKLTIQLLDDSSDETTSIAAARIAELSAKGYHIEHVRRPQRKGYKAGALEYGLRHDNSEFVAIFDADFLPKPNFIHQMLGYFVDAKVGMVQGRWEHLNADYSLVTRLMGFAIDNHFSVEHGGRQASNSFINFNGTGGMWRRKTIEDAGGWKSDTLTEDLDLSFRSQIKGWKFIFAEEVSVPAELPVQMSAVRSQQYRWTKGAAETGRKTLSNLWSSDATMGPKIVGSFHMLNSSIFLFLFVFGLSAAALPFVGLDHFWQVAIAMNIAIVTAFLANLFTYWTSQHKGDFVGQKPSLLRILSTTLTFMALVTGLSFHCAIAVVQGLAGKTTPFVRTPKLDVMAKAQATAAGHAYVARAIPWQVFVEVALAVIFTLLVIFGLGHSASIFAGVYLFYGIGFVIISTLSLREIYSSQKA